MGEVVVLARWVVAVQHFVVDHRRHPPGRVLVAELTLPAAAGVVDGRRAQMVVAGDVALELGLVGRVDGVDEHERLDAFDQLAAGTDLQERVVVEVETVQCVAAAQVDMAVARDALVAFGQLRGQGPGVGPEHQRVQRDPAVDAKAQRQRVRERCGGHGLRRLAAQSVEPAHAASAHRQRRPGVALAIAAGMWADWTCQQQHCHLSGPPG